MHCPQLLQQRVAGGRCGPARRVHEVPGREMRSRARRAGVRGPPRRRAEVVDACVEKDSPLVISTRPCWLSRMVTYHTATPSSRRRLDGVEVDATIQQNAP